MRDISTVAIVGRGIIGASWALVFARAGFRVQVWSREESDGEATRERVAALIHAVAGTGLEGDAETLARVSAHASMAATVDRADYVQESVAEKIDVKHEILAAIEESAAADVVIGSSTSGLLPSILAAGLKEPARFLVVHPLTPPHILPVTELCPGPKTSPDVVDGVSNFLRGVGQSPIRLHAEIPGFALNRVLGALMNEILALIGDGVLAPEDADAMLTDGFGLRWSWIGPFAAMDLNAPGGIEDYLRRYGHLWDAVARSRGAEPAITADVIAKISAAMRRRYRLEEAAERIARRDRGVAEMRRHRAAILAAAPSSGTSR
jgi:3-hydroxyacyl-CoA dehydrogenase